MKPEINKNIFNSFPSLESERLLFRKILLSDSKDLYLIRSEDEVMKYMDVPKMESLADADKLIKSIEKSYENETGISWRIVEKSSNNFIGYFGYWRIVPEHCRAEIGFALNPKYWGNGYMTETLNSMVRYGFKQMNLHSIEANVNPNNLSSIRLLEKIGFKKEAYFRENYLFNNNFTDSIIYSLLEKDLISSANI